MMNEHEPTGLSPSVLRVIDSFVAAMNEDDAIEAEAIDRLEKLLRKVTVPKPEEISVALFGPCKDSEK